MRAKGLPPLEPEDSDGPPVKPRRGPAAPPEPHPSKPATAPRVKPPEAAPDSPPLIVAPRKPMLPPAPPPKLKPASDYYSDYHNRENFEQDDDDDEDNDLYEMEEFDTDASGGWDSEDTLSDGGDFHEWDNPDIMTADQLMKLKRQSSLTISKPRAPLTEKKGFLYKKSSHMPDTTVAPQLPSGIFWKKQWVVFKNDELRIYASDKDFLSKMVIPIICMVNVEQNFKEGDSQPYRFILTLIDRTLTFAADKLDNAMLWTQLLMQAIVNIDATEEFLEGGAMNNPTKEGYIKMEGVKGKRYVVVKKAQMCYYNTYKDYKSAIPICRLEMQLCSVKEVGRTKLQLSTPQNPFILVFDHGEELQSWKLAFEEAIAEGLSDHTVMERVYENHSNRFCADCGVPEPEWASVNMGITLCKNCAGVHRSLACYSKVRSLKMDLRVWTDNLVKMFQVLGNDFCNNFWEWDATEDTRLTPDSTGDERKKYIYEKYVNKMYVRFHPLKDDKEALDEALCKAVMYEEVVETMQLVFSGADIFHVSANYSSNNETPLAIAERSGQTVQAEFLKQNGADSSGFVLMTPPPGTRPITQFPSSMSLAPPVSVSFQGMLYKTGAKNKGDFLLRWVTLENNVLSYYESQKSASPIDSVHKKEMIALAMASSTRQPNSFLLSTSKHKSRVYLFAAETEHQRDAWIHNLAKVIAPLPENFHKELTGFQKGGVIFKREGMGAPYEKTWLHLKENTLHIFDMENNQFEQIPLNRIVRLSKLNDKNNSCGVVTEFGPSFVIDLPSRAMYLQGDNERDTSDWFKLLDEAAKLSGQGLAEQHLTNNDVPVLVETCIAYVSAHGMEEEGIYRHSGQDSKVTGLLKSFVEDARKVNLGTVEVHVVCNVLKRFLRSLPDPVMTENLYQRWIAATQVDGEERLDRYKSLLKNLPHINYCTLKRIIFHLVLVFGKEPKNKMSAGNLAAIFGPVLMTPTNKQSKSSQGFCHTNTEICVVKDLLEYNQTLFDVKDDLAKKIEEGEKKIVNAFQNKVTSVKDQWLITIKIQESKGDVKTEVKNELLVRLESHMTASQVLQQVVSEKELEPSKNWGLVEVVYAGDLYRPLHYSENVMETMLKWSSWPAEFSVNNHFRVKVNDLYTRLDQVFEPHHSVFGELKFSDKNKGFKKYSFKFSQLQVSYQKDNKSLMQLGTWRVEDLTLYMGCPVQRKPSNDFVFTFIKNGEHIVKNKENPYLGHSVCCNNEDEMYRWVAAILKAQNPKGLIRHMAPSEFSDTVCSSPLTSPSYNSSFSSNSEASPPPTISSGRQRSVFKKLFNKSSKYNIRNE